MYTSLNDFARYDHALRMQEGLPQGILDNLFEINHSPVINESCEYPYAKGKPVFYHNGWFVTSEAVFHSGGWIGTSTFVMHGIETPVTITINCHLAFI